ncbi:MAG: NAD(P)H-hydrate dehydratase [Acidimicrobiaceae bacterium]|nr:NAD(P)H-hydrate dehydratase [Acidimicrobiaceae bacterium]
MIPVYRQSDIKAFDHTLASNGMVESAISRAGYSVFALASKLLGGCYGKRVTAIYGPGNNGRDTLVAAKHLRLAGAVVSEVGYGTEEFMDESSYIGADLVVDGCFGVGLSRPFHVPPLDPGVPVLAVDVPSGLDGDKGTVIGTSVAAAVTLCLSGVKLGVLVAQGPEFCGDVYLADLGIGDLGSPMLQEFLVEDDDLFWLVNRRQRTDHKWSHSVAVIAGSPGMAGAARLVCSAAYLAGAGIVHLYTDMGDQCGDYGVETVVHKADLFTQDTQGKEALFSDISERFKSLVIGPGLGRGSGVTELVERAVSCRLPLVIDADGISAVPSIEWLASRISPDHPGVILTPHQGELKALLGRSAAQYGEDYSKEDICSFAREFALRSGASLLIKGGPTVVSSPRGGCYITSAPSSSLAVAGSGDVLSGMIGAAISYQGDLAILAAVTAHLHGLAGRSLSSGLSGELANRARQILSRFKGTRTANRDHSFQKPMPIEGNLVAGSQLLGGHTHGLV